jgi:hypothetical protein
MGGRNWCERVTFEVFCQLRPGDNGETHESIAGVQAEIRTWYVQNTSQKHCRAGQLVRSNAVLLRKLTSGNLTFKQQKKLPINFSTKLTPSLHKGCHAT